jgi:hypothetical protein
MGIVDDAKKVVYDTFGEFSAKKVEFFAEEINAGRHPKEFLDRCVSFVSGMLGEAAAKEKFSKLYSKYGKKAS